MKPLAPHLLPGPNDTASDMHVQSGYPIWNLIADFALDPAEWAAAKAFYLDHKAVIDARIILNQEPARDLVEGLTTPEAFFAWALKQGE